MFGLHRDTVRKMLEYSVPPGYRRPPPRRPKLDPYQRFSRVGPGSDTPRIAPARLRRPRRPPGPTRPLGPTPCQQAPLSQPGQGLGPVQKFDVLDEGEDAVANPLVS